MKQLPIRRSVKHPSLYDMAKVCYIHISYVVGQLASLHPEYIVLVVLLYNNRRIMAGDRSALSRLS